MNEWWKAPVLQGEDNDYGQYDYLIEEIPENYMGWEFDREYKWACSECHKEYHLDISFLFVSLFRSRCACCSLFGSFKIACPSWI